VAGNLHRPHAWCFVWSLQLPKGQPRARFELAASGDEHRLALVDLRLTRLTRAVSALQRHDLVTVSSIHRMAAAARVSFTRSVWPTTKSHVPEWSLSPHTSWQGLRLPPWCVPRSIVGVEQCSGSLRRDSPTSGGWAERTCSARPQGAGCIMTDLCCRQIQTSFSAVRPPPS
jgi:hypothetical protein